MLMSFDKNVSQLLEGWMGMNTVRIDERSLLISHFMVAKDFPLARDLENQK